MSNALSIAATENRDLFSLAFPDKFVEEMQSIHNQIELAAFNLFERRGMMSGSALSDWLNAESSLLKPVPVTVVDERDHLKVTAEVPGFALDELKVHVDGQELSICGSHNETASGDGKKAEKATSTLKVCCTVMLPATVKADAALATLDKGVLTMTLPKAQPSREIPVKAAA